MVTGRGGGTVTWLPSAGQVIGRGQALYKVDNGSPVVLLYGSVPDWRAMSAGTTGADVSQLNHDLVRLGYADSADISALGWDYYSWETRYRVHQMEEHLGSPARRGRWCWARWCSNRARCGLARSPAAWAARRAGRCWTRPRPGPWSRSAWTLRSRPR